MIQLKDILSTIKKTVKSVDPTATVILYGSFARGDNDKDSDIDLLILVDKPRLTPQESKKIKYPLYDIEFETGQIISPLVLTRGDWETRHKITPFYENVTRDGRAL
jgi:predicted nucleotidyltransferase